MFTRKLNHKNLIKTCINTVKRDSDIESFLGVCLVMNEMGFLSNKDFLKTVDRIRGFQFKDGHLYDRFHCEKLK